MTVDGAPFADGAPAEVVAAGTVCWRPARPAAKDASGPTVEIALVHRPHRQDWSLPKGKQEPDELLPICAVRETTEETGAEVILGPALPAQEYVLPDGRTKQVSFWTARVIRMGKRTAPAKEIDDVRWVSPGKAVSMLSHDSDRALVTAFTKIVCPDCYPVLVVRHVTARPRDAWPRADADRPLVSSGRRQAKTLVGLLSCWRPEYLVSSPWKRCVETLVPYRDQFGAKLRTKSGLSEDGFRRDPGKAQRHTEKVLNRGYPALICTHRPVLPRVLDTVKLHCHLEALAALPTENPYLVPGEVLILHTRMGHDGPHVVAVERHLTPR